MKILYGYIEIGDRGYFQSLNQFPPDQSTLAIVSGPGLSVYSSSTPAISNSVLYLNGRNLSARFQILSCKSKVINNFLVLIKEHNARLNNV